MRPAGSRRSTPCSIRAAALETAKQYLADNPTARRSMDKDLISVQQRHGKYKEQLMAVKTNDEYRAMQHQIEAVAAEVGQHEERVLVQHDGRRRDQREHQEGGSGAQGGAGESRRGACRNRKRRHDAASGRRRVRGRARQRSSRRWTTRARSKPSSASPRSAAPQWRAPKASAAPSARCRLRPAVFTEVRKNDSLVQCDSCNRILYFVPPRHPGTRGHRHQAPDHGVF